MYREIFDKNSLITYSINQKYDKKHFSSGIYESNILCRECDNEIIGKIETYAANALYYNNFSVDKKIKCKTKIHPNGTEIRIVTNIDYNKFKLFLLSILWRASISSHPFFNEITLSKEHEKTIREYLLNENNIPENIYRINLCFCKEPPSNLITNSILNPFRIGNKTETYYYVFYIARMFYLIEIKKKNIEYDFFYNGNIKQNNSIEIPIVDENFVKIIFQKVFNNKDL